ncbi:STN domain-containing protein [Paraflavitalea speifideaquila]|uniref:STN domain-containing protein n=1 Tax=Paraflavitalea speifideaquila TaxID=3076558 RepID=UPI0028EEBBB7|nr:carboxypeptidase-like regulatory domain-containing protein [Paraflavitalea speifideiaquila]
MSAVGFAQRNPTSQQRLITISMQRVSLETVFTEIEKQTNYRFIYKPVLLAHANKVSLQVRNATIEEILPLIFKDQPFEYELFKESVLLTPPRTSTARTIDEEPPRTSIKGRIVNKTGDPIPSATVIALRSKQQITTGENGDFTLNNMLLKDSLIVSSVGYETRFINLKGNQDLLIELQLVARELSKVVVASGYQKAPIEQLTGSFSKIDNKLLNYKVGTNVLDRLEGVTPSVLFIKNKQEGVNQSSINIRGRSTIFAYPDPLIILDHFPYTGDVNNINPNDIESITILKDAAAASIWGPMPPMG